MQTAVFNFNQFRWLNFSRYSFQWTMLPRYNSYVPTTALHASRVTNWRMPESVEYTLLRHNRGGSPPPSHHQMF